MQLDDLQHRPYELLGHMSRDASLSSLPQLQENPAVAESPSLELTTMYITTMYYAALANLYMQSALPKTFEEVDAENPRLKIAFNRSYADFMAASQWLDKKGAKFVTDSAAKSYYDEVSGMGENMITNVDSFYSRNNS